MTRSKKSKLERQSKRILMFKVMNDEHGNYVGYCSYAVHFGIVGERKARECERRGCNHYRKYREETKCATLSRNIVMRALNGV